MRNSSGNTVCLSVHPVLSYTLPVGVLLKNSLHLVCFFCNESYLVSSVSYTCGIREVIPIATSVRLLVDSVRVKSLAISCIFEN